MNKIKRFLRDKSFITLLAIGIITWIIIAIFFVLNRYGGEFNRECYWTTKGIICSWGKLGV